MNEDFRLRFVLPGKPITKKNSSRIVGNGNKKRLMPSLAYVRYERDCLWQTPPKAKLNIDFPVNVQYVYYMPTRRAVDLTNLENATDDILVKAGVLADDNCRIVARHDGSYVDYDKDNPRVEITITGYHGPTL